MNDLINKLSGLREKEIIRDIDIEICRFLNDKHQNMSKEVLKAACLVSHLYGQGDVCLPLDEYADQQLFKESGEEVTLRSPRLDLWLAALQESSAVGQPGDYQPLILDASNRLYLQKLWQYEKKLSEKLIEKSRQETEDINLSLLKDGLDRLFGDTTEDPDWQRVAAAKAIKKKLSIISGGPGTGKTSTVVRILALLLEQASENDQSPAIALAAPTGKAAARLKDSILSAKDTLSIEDSIRSAIPDKAMTLHKLLGARRHSSVFRHDAENPVPYDLVVVDEASMVDQTLMYKLMNALLDNTQVILLGDKDQLASVEAGSVLGDICDTDTNSVSDEMAKWLEEVSLNIPAEYISDRPKSLADNITLLTKSYRFSADSGIARLAEYINRGASGEAVNVLSSGDYPDTSLIPIADQSDLVTVFKDKLTEYFQQVIKSDSPIQALNHFSDLQILAAHRRGPWGIKNMNKLAEQLLQQQGLIPKYEHWYAGKPVMVNINDYTLGLRNGDIGICLYDEHNNLKIYFRDEDSVKAISPGRLPDHSMAYTLTVHKSQGSEFEEVVLVLPDHHSKVLSRQLIYTAVTRARTSLSVLADESLLSYAIETQLRRSSGLRDHLWT